MSSAAAQPTGGESFGEGVALQRRGGTNGSGTVLILSLDFDHPFIGEASPE